MNNDTNNLLVGERSKGMLSEHRYGHSVYFDDFFFSWPSISLQCISHILYTLISFVHTFSMCLLCVTIVHIWCAILYHRIVCATDTRF